MGNWGDEWREEREREWKCVREMMIWCCRRLWGALIDSFAFGKLVPKADEVSGDVPKKQIFMLIMMPLSIALVTITNKIMVKFLCLYIAFSHYNQW